MRRTLNLAMAGLIATVTMLGTLVAPAAAATTAAHNWVYRGRTQIRNSAAPYRCLDAFYSEGGGNGNRVGLWDCNDGITEKWDIWQDTLAHDGWDISILNARNQKSLDYPASSGGALGWQYELWTQAESTGQRFAVTCNPAPWANCRIQVQISGDSVTMDAFASDGGGNGNRVGNWSITDSPLQRWSFPKLYGA
jgi:hypothetical protein